MLGLGQGAKVPAQFTLTNKPILILIDDPAERVDWPPTTRYLFEDLSQELLRRHAAEKIIPRETLERLRPTITHFEKRGCREIGELVHARQVLWIEVRDFLADELIQDTRNAAYFTVTVKVINVLEKKQRSRVRLWPRSPRGHLMTVSLTGSEVARAKTKDAMAKKLAAMLATDIAKLFYGHRLGDFERQK